HITTGMPFVILKVAMTLDGKIATESGDSKWITSLASRRYVHRLRSRVDAVLTAIGTVKADDPQLTVRLIKGRNPVRVVIDPEFEIPLTANLLKTPPPTIIFTKNKAHSPLPEGVEVEYFDSERLDLGDAMKRLYQRGITSVLIEGGSSLNYYALKDGIVDKVLFFIAPKIMGGKNSIPSVGGISPGLDYAWRIKDLKTRKIGEDFLVEGYVESSSLRPEFSS
ncbi:MAG: bifunctional diaminohydroxyphosphoribosylaminopyrimidine deaminase/5-amino-6-(5-phosphoribosylamino)uracil reductase RibD, partial [Thermodesulfovibrionales bacterium]